MKTLSIPEIVYSNINRNMAIDKLKTPLPRLYFKWPEFTKNP